MDVYTAIKNRREITRFTTDVIPDEVQKQLVQSMFLAPAGNNLPSREFIWVADRVTLTNLSTTSPYMKWLEHAGAGVVIIGDPGVSKYWLQDATIAGSFLWLSAVSVGLGLAWGAVYHSEDSQESMKRESYVRHHLSIPKQYRVIAILGLGYPAVTPDPKEMYALDRVYHSEQYMGRG